MLNKVSGYENHTEYMERSLAVVERMEKLVKELLYVSKDWIGPPSAGFRWNETGLLWDFHTRGYALFHCFRPAFFCLRVTVWVNGKFPFAKAYQSSHYENLPPRKPIRPGFVPVCKTVLQSACRRAILSP